MPPQPSSQDSPGQKQDTKPTFDGDDIDDDHHDDDGDNDDDDGDDDDDDGDDGDNDDDDEENADDKCFKVYTQPTQSKEPQWIACYTLTMGRSTRTLSTTL